MTTFGSVFKATADRKKGPLILILLFELLFIVAYVMIDRVSKGTASDFTGFLLWMLTVLLSLLGQVYLIVRQEEVWRQNRYRLAPISTGKLMVANYASSLVLDLLFLLIINISLPIMEFALYHTSTYASLDDFLSTIIFNFVPKVLLPAMTSLVVWFGLTTFSLLFSLFKRRLGATTGLVTLVFIGFIGFAFLLKSIALLGWIDFLMLPSILVIFLPLLAVVLFFLNRGLIEVFIETDK